MRLLLLLTVTLLFISCKKQGEPFNADFTVKAKSKISSIKIVDYTNAKEGKTLYNNPTPVNSDITGYFKYQISGSLSFDHNTSVLIKLKFEEPGTEFSFSSQDRETSRTTTIGEHDLNFTFVSNF